MTTGEKIYECRKKAGMTQEELADKLGVTRQAVSRWEQDQSFPETKQIMELCRLFSLSADELLFGREDLSERSEEVEAADEPSEQNPKAEEDGKGKTWGVIDHKNKWRFEYISRRRIFGMPLVHIHLGFGLCRAHGFFSLGIVSAGFFSAGIFSAGLFSLGVFALGLLGIGCFALAGAAFATFAFGLFAAGAVAVGILSFGAIAVGEVAVGAIAVGQFAVGDHAYGWLAAGLSRASGEHAYLLQEAFHELTAFLDENVSHGLASFLEGCARILRK